MSTFYCEFCGLMSEDTRYGYVRGCVHYKPDAPGSSQFFTCSICGCIDSTVTSWGGVMICNGCYIDWLSKED